MRVPYRYVHVRSFWWVGGGFSGSSVKKLKYLENGTLPVNPNITGRKGRVLRLHWWVYYIENYPTKNWARCVRVSVCARALVLVGG